MEFDYIFALPLRGGRAIEYGILYGSAPIVLIKSGRGGSCRGEGDKYLQMAIRLREACGCTVVCSSNPVGADDGYLTDEAVLKKFFAESGAPDGAVYLIGSSNGIAKRRRP